MNENEENKPMDEVALEILAEDEREELRARNIHLLPNAITTSAMFFGFFSIMMSIAGNFEYAAWAIVIAGVMDSMDGRVARLVKGTSAFGIEYDSLSDLISFGFAPAMLTYTWALSEFGRLGWAAAFIYLACTAIRLAKFNTLTADEESKRYFRGLPSPGAAGLILIMVLMHIEIYPELYTHDLVMAKGAGIPPESFAIRGGMLIWVILLSLLMVSNVRFRTFKDVHLTKHGPWLPLAGVAAFIAVLMARPQQTLFIIGITYLSMGLIEGGIIFRRREKELRETRREAKKQRRLKRKLAKKRIKLAKKEARKNRT